MSLEALIADLRRKSSDRIQQIRAEAEGKADELRRRKQEEFARYEAVVLGQLQDLKEGVAAPILHEAERSALAIEDEALGRLSERLAALAAGMLDRIRDQDYEAVFAALAGEMPAVSWERVRVNPLDMELARAAFPGVEVGEDPAITGGFVASADSERYLVDNTLERRLERAWPVILPLLIGEIVKEKHAASFD